MLTQPSSPLVGCDLFYVESLQTSIHGLKLEVFWGNRDKDIHQLTIFYTNFLSRKLISNLFHRIFRICIWNHSVFIVHVWFLPQSKRVSYGDGPVSPRVRRVTTALLRPLSPSPYKAHWSTMSTIELTQEIWGKYVINKKD